MPDVSVLNVHLHGRPIATLTHVQGNRNLFAFNQAYIDDPNRSTLSLSFKDQFGGLVTDFKPVGQVVRLQACPLELGPLHVERRVPEDSVLALSIWAIGP